jgi:hypothetical protein
VIWRIERPGLVSSGHVSEQLEVRPDLTIVNDRHASRPCGSAARLGGDAALVRVNRRQLADILGISMPTVTAWVGEGMPFTREGSKSAEWEFDTRECH